MTDDNFYNYDDNGMLIEEEILLTSNLKNIPELSKLTGIDEKVLDKEAAKLKKKSGLGNNYAMGILCAKYMSDYSKVGTGDEV